MSKTMDAVRYKLANPSAPNSSVAKLFDITVAGLYHAMKREQSRVTPDTCAFCGHDLPADPLAVAVQLMQRGVRSLAKRRPALRLVEGAPGEWDLFDGQSILALGESPYFVLDALRRLETLPDTIKRSLGALPPQMRVTCTTTPNGYLLKSHAQPISSAMDEAGALAALADLATRARGA